MERVDHLVLDSYTNLLSYIEFTGSSFVRNF